MKDRERPIPDGRTCIPISGELTLTRPSAPGNWATKSPNRMDGVRTGELFYILVTSQAAPVVEAMIDSRTSFAIERIGIPIIRTIYITLGVLHV